MIASYFLSILSIISLWLISRDDRFGWLLGVWVQVPWAIYALYTNQPGFALLGVVLAYINLRGYLRHGQ